MKKNEDVKMPAGTEEKFTIDVLGYELGEKSKDNGMEIISRKLKELEEYKIIKAYESKLKENSNKQESNLLEEKQ